MLYAPIVLMLITGTIIGVRRRDAIGFLGCWFFGILALTSSVIPIPLQPIAEQRMYLPLAAVVTLAVVGIYTLIGWRSVVVCLAVAVGLGFLTIQRNRDYRSELAIWSDTVAKRPANPWAHDWLGEALIDQGRVAEAIDQFDQALRLKPNYVEAHNDLGMALASQGNVAKAVEQYEQALAINPDYPPCITTWEWPWPVRARSRKRSSNTSRRCGCRSNRIPPRSTTTWDWLWPVRARLPRLLSNTCRRCG